MKIKKVTFLMAPEIFTKNFQKLIFNLATIMQRKFSTPVETLLIYYWIVAKTANKMLFLFNFAKI